MRSLTIAALIGLPGCSLLASVPDDSVGDGGSGGAGQTVSVQGSGGGCQDGDTRACYSGPLGTEKVGDCVAGIQLCEGGTFGECVGEVVPAATDVCLDSNDEDCTGCACGGYSSARLLDGGYGRMRLAVLPSGRIAVAGDFDGQGTIGGPTFSTAVSTAFVAVYEADGTYVSGRLFQSSNTSGVTGITVTPAGFAVAGNFSGTLDLDAACSVTAPDGSGFVAQFDEESACDWVTAITGPASQSVSGLGINGVGQLYAVGQATGDVTVGSFSSVVGAGESAMFRTALNPANGEAESLLVDGGGTFNVESFAARGDTYAAAVGDGPSSFYFLRWSEADPTLFDQFFLSSASINVPGTAISSQGLVAFGGGFSGSVQLGTGALPLNSAGDTDGFFVVYSPTLASVGFARSIGGPGQDNVLAVAYGPDDDLYVAGYVIGPADFGAGTQGSGVTADGYLAKYDTSGALVWVRLVAGPDLQVGSGIAAVGDTVALSGYTVAPIDLGGGLLTNTSVDKYLATYCP